MNTARSSWGERAVSAAIMIWAAGWLAYYRNTAPDDAVALVVTACVGIGGLVVSFAVWGAKRGALRMYAAWAIADVLALILLDARVEPEWWRVGLGALPAAALLAAFGWRLAASRRRRLRSA